MGRLQTHWDWVSSYLALPNSGICVSMKQKLGSDKVKCYSGEMLLVSFCWNRIWKAQEAMQDLQCELVGLELFSHPLLCNKSSSRIRLHLFQCYLLLMLRQLKVWALKNCLTSGLELRKYIGLWCLRTLWCEFGLFSLVWTWWGKQLLLL